MCTAQLHISTLLLLTTVAWFRITNVDRDLTWAQFLEKIPDLSGGDPARSSSGSGRATPSRPPAVLSNVTSPKAVTSLSTGAGKQPLG